MEQKKDSKGRHVRTSPTKEELQKKIQYLEEQVNHLATLAQESKNECTFWKQEYDVAKRYIGNLEKELNRAERMRNWLYERAWFVTKMKYNGLVSNSEF